MKHLRALEDQSVYILREAYKHFDDLAMLWSMGKDSTVLLWLARKAFFGHVPFPLVHIDTGYEMPELIEYRDRLCREWHLDLVVGQNTEALAAGMGPQQGRVTCCTAMKIDAFTYADLALGIFAGYRWFNFPIERPEYKNARAYYDRLAQRPAYKEHVMQPIT